MILAGVSLLARGRADGIKQFGNTSEALAGSLAPLIAFPLVGAGLTASSGDWRSALVMFLSRLTAVLAVPVIIFEYARWTKREADWIRTAAALNWSFWILLPLVLLAAVFAAGLQMAGLSLKAAEYAGIGFIVAYSCWLWWFIVRVGLRLGRASAVLLTLLNAVVVGLFTLLANLH